MFTHLKDRKGTQLEEGGVWGDEEALGRQRVAVIVE